MSEVDYQKNEKKWQRKWEKERVFEADPESQGKKFFITVPYPYTNGALHIGHGRTYTIGDIVARVKRMQGFNVLFPMASHMTGTPIVGMVERIKAGDKIAIEQYKRDLRLYLDTEEAVEKQLVSFTDPWTTAKFFADAISSDFKALGYSIDWRRKFTTGDKIYNKFIEWQYHKFMEKGYIKQGNYPLLYCPNCRNPVGEDDLLEGETAKIKEFIAIKFRYRDGYLVAATLRPETVFGITNMWINPKATYVWAKVDDEKWIVSKEAAEKLNLQAKNIEIMEEFQGKNIIGERFKAVHDDHEILILPAAFVNPDNATGVVYSVPGHAPFDYIALRDLWENPSDLEKYGISKQDVRDIKIISMIDIRGYGEYPAKDAVERRNIKSQKEEESLEEATQEIYKAEFYDGIMKENCMQFSGRIIKEVKDDIIEWMKGNNACDIFYEPDQRPVICKCGTSIQVGVFAGQWFLDYTSPGWKEKAWKALDEMTIVPDLFRNLFEATFDWLAQRPCARKRGIGTRLPFDKEWIIESLSDSTIYMAFYTISHHLKKSKIKPEQLIPEFFEYVFLGKSEQEDLSKKTGIDEDLLKTMQDEFRYWYPNDQRHTAPSHISNHLSFAIFHHVAIFPKKHWLQCISLNEHVNMEGGKMSKSKGNVIPLVEIPKKYGADIYRTYVVSAAEPGSLMDWRERDVPAVKSRMKQFVDLMMKYSSKEARVFRKKDKPRVATKWTQSRVNSIVQSCTDFIERFRLRDYAIFTTSEMMRVVNHYLARPEIPKEEREGVMAYICDIWVRLFAPIAPHICEEVWSKMDKDGYVSLAPWPRADKQLIDKGVESSHQVIEETISDIREILKLLKGKRKERVQIYVAEDWMFDALARIRDAGIPLMASELMKLLMSNPEFRRHGERVKSLVNRIVKQNGLWEYSPSAKDELLSLREAADFMASTLDLEIRVQDAGSPDYDPENKARSALPGRPSFYLE